MDLWNISLEQSPINEYLSLSKSKMHNVADFITVIVVMGNETCDLDSAVSSLVYGFSQHELLKNTQKSTLVATIYNIQQSEMHLKTEVVFWLRKLNVDVNLIIFRDQVDLDQLYQEGKLRLILVDHHVLPPRLSHLLPSVVEVIDHRPIEKSVSWPNALVIIDLVGSCATLIARELLEKQKDIYCPQLALLLYGAIILDTAGLSETSGRTKPLDVSVAITVECMVKGCNRTDVLKLLIEARADIESLSSGDLLVKDMKIVGSIPLCGFPILVKKFIKMPDAGHALHNFCVTRSISLVILMGQEIEDGTFIRDIAIYSLGCGSENAKKLTEYLKASQDSLLQLTEDTTSDSSKIEGLLLYSQHNYKASRKQVIPMVQTALQEIPELADLKYPLKLK